MIHIFRSAFFFLFLLYSLAAIANADLLRGRIEMTDGTPVSHAQVILHHPHRVVTTDEEGKFRIPHLQPGTYEVEVRCVGVKSARFQLQLNERSHLHLLRVEPNTIEVNEATVTALSAKAQLQTQGFAIDVVETQKFALQNVQTTELLDRAAGVRIRQDGGLGSRHRFSLNGFSGNAVKIFIDGVPARNYGSSFSMTSIPPALIERIEVYKGVVPGHLAEDALGGAVNIILKRRQQKSLVTSYSIGSFNTHQWNAAGSYRWNNGLTVDASAFYNHSDNNYQVWGRDVYFQDAMGNVTESNGKRVRRFNDSYRSAGTKFAFGWTDVAWADRLLVGGVFSDDYKEIQNGTTMKIVYGNRHYRRHAKVGTLNYDKRNFLTPGLDVALEASYSSLERENVDTVGLRYTWGGLVYDQQGEPLRYKGNFSETNTTRKVRSINNDDVALLRTNIDYALAPSQRLRMVYLFNHFVRHNTDPYLPEAERRLSDTRDLQKQVASLTYEGGFWNDRLRTSLFYKHFYQKGWLNQPYYNTELQAYEQKRTALSRHHAGYGMTLSWALRSGWHLLASAERALRLPTEDELFGNVTQDLSAAPDLRPEISHNINLGIDFKHQIEEHQFGANAMVYFRDTRDMIREIFSPREDWSAFANLERTETKGIDAELFYNYADRFNLRFSVSRFDILFNTKYDYKGHPYNYYRTQIPNEPSFKFNLNAGYTFKDLLFQKSRLTTYANVGYVNEFLRNWSNVGSSNLKTIPRQTPIDLGLTYHLPNGKVVLNFDVKNITDQQIFDNYGLQKPGRSFHAKVTYFIL